MTGRALPVPLHFRSRCSATMQLPSTEAKYGSAQCGSPNRSRVTEKKISSRYLQISKLVFGPHTHTHTHTRLTALFPGLPGWASTRKVKPIWILLKQRDSEWQWHQLGHMQACISLQTGNHASTPLLSFLQAGCSSCRPTNSVKALKS